MKKFINLALGCGLISGCITGPGASGTIGYGPDRRVVIVGEKVTDEIALYYQRRYDAKVWYTPSRGKLKDSAEIVLKGLGPSVAMRSLINELESMNYEVRKWEIIVPGIAEGYVFETLKGMPDGAMEHARGDFVLIDSKGNKDIEAEVARVTNGSFFVSYEFQKYQ